MRQEEIRNWLDTQKEEMISLVSQLAEINSGSTNAEGLNRVARLLEGRFGALSDPAYSSTDRQEGTSDLQRSCEKSGPILLFHKRKEAPFKILLSGHYDTVFGPEHPFQHVHREQKRLCGPGVADMKGGLVIMLKTLEALEKFQIAEQLAWTVVLTPDEERGSPVSAPKLAEIAPGHAVGLVFEPSWPDGSLVSARKGSANVTLILKGRAAHAGRHFHEGKSAIYALAKAITKIEKLIRKNRTINVGTIEGGTSLNIVAENASCRINIRADREEEMEQVIEMITEIASSFPEISYEMIINTRRPPKPFDQKTKNLFTLLKKCAKSIDVDLHWQPSGGVCDGNTLAAAGLPTIDSVGVVGGGIHTDQEYLMIDSLTERTLLMVLFLQKLAKQL